MLKTWSPCLRRLIRRCAVITCLGAVLLAAVWIFRAPLLIAVAHAWIVDQPPGHADAIVILGGGEQYRPAKAAELYHAGVAPLILIPKTNPRLTDLLNITPPAHDVSLKVLAAKGVPESAIQVMDTRVRTTKDEAEAVSEWSRRNKARKIVIPTDIWHTRRAEWIFHRSLKNETQVAVVPVNPDEYNADNWWQSEHGLIAFDIEVTKMIFYWFKH
jgi:uncharacterized SAM-binding protein YcdF (DUF218 family)